MPPPVQCSDSLATAMQEVDKEESKISISGRKVVLLIAKAGDTHEYWPRLLASKEKQNNITVSCYLLILKWNMPSNYTLAALSVSVLKSPLNRVCITHIRRCGSVGSSVAGTSVQCVLQLHSVAPLTM